MSSLVLLRSSSTYYPQLQRNGSRSTRNAVALSGDNLKVTKFQKYQNKLVRFFLIYALCFIGINIREYYCLFLAAKIRHYFHSTKFIFHRAELSSPKGGRNQKVRCLDRISPFQFSTFNFQFSVSPVSLSPSLALRSSSSLPNRRVMPAEI